MKRLLVYLFVVLGLGLTFNVNAKSAELKHKFCGPTERYNVGYRLLTYINEKNGNCYPLKKVNSDEYVLYKLLHNTKKLHNDNPAKYKSQQEAFNSELNKMLKDFKNKKISSKIIINTIEDNWKLDKFYNNYKTQIAKAEPSQTPVELLKNLTKLYEDGVIDKSQFEKTKKKILLMDDTQIANAEASKTQKINNIKAECKEQIGWDGEVRTWIICKKEPKKIKNTVKVTKKEPKKIKKENIKAECKEQIGWDGEVRSWIICEKEPSPTQKVTKKPLKHIPDNVKFCNAKLDYTGYMTKSNCWRQNTLSEFVYFNLYKISSNETVLSNNLNRLYGQFNQFNIDYDLINKIILEDQKYERYRKFIKNNNTQIAKVETDTKPKKKVNIVKIEELKQEEFKPDNKDNEAPVIEIAEAITVNDSTYEIEGKVIDKSKKLFVQIDGETLPVKKGKFKIKRFSPIDEQLKIVAIDQWGNKSKPKIVNVTVDVKETIVADKLEQLNPSLIKSRSNKNRVALIIGIEKYEQTPAANFANLDAKYFYEYARKGFGIPKANIKLLVDEEASLIKSISTINKWLPSKIKNNQTELIIFFAGHGLASNNGEELYILPQDSDPDLLSRTALSRTELFEQIIKLNPKSVTMFMDTCYSGISRDEKMLLASARPIRIVADDQEGIPDNFTIFTASKLDQISSGLKEAEHGIFSYYLMKGLEGKADSNQDKKITNGELLSYMNENVSQKAAELGREQNPSLSGDPDKVLISYR